MVVCMGARILRIPVFLHESDSVAGLSNKKVSKFAKKVFISFEKTEGFDSAKTPVLEQSSLQGKTILVGNPIKKELLNGNNEEARKIFNVSFEKPMLLFSGGSQGAEAINDFITIVLNDLLKNYEVLHVTGAKNYKKTQAESQIILNKALEKYYHVYPSLDEIELKNAYKVADFVIARAGSGTIFEIAACGKPSILIPLPSSASGHQLKNAYQYSKTGAALVIEQKNLTPNFFWGELNYLLSQPEVLQRMKDSALQFARPMAAEHIAREIIEYVISHDTSKKK